MLCLCILCAVPSALTAQRVLTGSIIDIDNQEPLIGACLNVVGTNLGVCTELDGTLQLADVPAPPFTVELTYLGYTARQVEVTDLSTAIQFGMEQQQLALQQVEVRGEGSRLKQELSLTVESLGLAEIERNSEASFYDVLATMRETDLLTVSFGVKVINTRGFNSSTPVRSLQLIDGVDNASPGLNYPLGNFLGLPELDVQGVDLVIGASSAYFGPGAFNGVINMRTKNPFDYQGLEAQVKYGERSYREASLRWAHAFKDKQDRERLGVKLNMTYTTVYDWVADNANPSFGALADSIYADNPGGYDAVNRYGDEAQGNYTSLFEQFRHPGLWRFYRTGYWEEDLANYDSYNFKTSAGLFYRFGKDWEIVTTGNYGRGTTVMQLDNRLSLNDVFAYQPKLEIKKKDRFFLRMFMTGENAGDTYDIVSTASKLQSRWRGDGEWLNGYKNHWFSNINPMVKELPGFPEIGPAPDFYYDFDGAQMVLDQNVDMIREWHKRARASQDGGYLVPGTPEFDLVFDDIINTKVSEGGTKYVDESKLYDMHAQYRILPKFADAITLGGNYRRYHPYSEGTIFSDTSGTSIRTYEYGLYAGIERTFASRFKIDFAARLDKHQNYDLLFSPAVSFQYIIDPVQSIRFSVSSALRNPTLIDQYYFFRVGSALLLGNTTGYTNLISLKSFEDYLDNGLDASLLEYFDEPPVKPEEALALELAYSGLFFEFVDVKSALYLNRYEDFIGYKIGLDVPFFMGFPGQPNIFRFAANAKDITYTTGFSTALTLFTGENSGIRANYSWNKIFIDSDDPLIPAYNTPEHKVNLGFQVGDLTIAGVRHMDVGFNFRWVEGYKFESSPQFSGRIPAQYHLNGQISKRFPKLRSTLKVSGSNLLNRQQNGLYGGPAVGRFVFLSWHYSSY